MNDKIFCIIGLATCIIVAVAVILIAFYILLRLWCKFIMDTCKVIENSREIRSWFREKDSFYQWKSWLDSFTALENYRITSVDFNVESGEISCIYGEANNIDEARKSIFDKYVFKIKSMPFIISYLDNSGSVEFTPVKEFVNND